MEDFSEYDKAQAKYYGQLNVKTVPVMSWEFNHRFTSEMKSIASDLKKLQNLAADYNWNTDLNFEERIREETIVVTDHQLKIVYSSESMLEMNGYSEEEVLGQSPKMFQGKDTDVQSLLEINDAIQQRKPFSKTVLNYKKNGKIYHCRIDAYPIFNLQNEFTHFIAFEKAA